MAVVTIRMRTRVHCECGNITGRSWWPISVQDEITVKRAHTSPVCDTIQFIPETFVTVNRPALETVR